jgi:hypothetical protein
VTIEMGITSASHCSVVMDYFRARSAGWHPGRAPTTDDIRGAPHASMRTNTIARERVRLRLQ